MERKETVRYWRGNHISLPNEMISGRILVEEDTGHVYLDYKDRKDGELKRRKLTDTDKFNKLGGIFEGHVIAYSHPDEAALDIESNSLPLDTDLLIATKKYVDDVSNRQTQHEHDYVSHITENERKYWNEKVNPEPGKTLSTNDFTDVLKKKLDKISEGANKVSYTNLVDDGNDIGQLEIDDVTYSVKMPRQKDITGNAETATALQTPIELNGVMFDGTENVHNYGSCSSIGSDNVKVATIQNFKLTVGSYAHISFTNDNTSENPKLNISSTGAYAITIERLPISKDQLNRGVYTFAFDGEHYEMVQSSGGRYANATPYKRGLMSAADKQKLDNINEESFKYVLPVASETMLGGIKVGQNLTMENETLSVTKTNITDALGLEPISITTVNKDYIISELGAFIPPTDTNSGGIGLVPAPQQSQLSSLLKSDGTWVDMSRLTMDPCTSTKDGNIGFVPVPPKGKMKKVLTGEAIWSDPEDLLTTITNDDIAALVDPQGFSAITQIKNDYPTANFVPVQYLLVYDIEESNRIRVYIDKWTAGQVDVTLSAGLTYVFEISYSKKLNKRSWFVIRPLDDLVFHTITKKMFIEFDTKPNVNSKYDVYYYNYTPPVTNPYVPIKLECNKIYQ